MLLLAASTLEKLSQVPSTFWLKVAAGIVGLVIAILLLRKLAEVNKVVLGAVLVIGFGILGFQWIYERNEPAFLTPAVDAIAPFFPAKDSYATTQTAEPDRPKAKKSAPAR